MLRNFLKIAWRNLSRNKGFTITNILGLTIGITCTIFIFLWVQDELTYDQFHSNHRNIYQVMANRNFNNQVFTDRNMVFPLVQFIEKKYPQIKNAAVTTYGEQHVLTNGETMLKKTGYTVSEHYFDIFSWKFIKGNAATAIIDPYSIVLTQSTASALFGPADPVNKVLRVDDQTNVKVTAVVADLPGNSTFQFDYIRPFNYADSNVQKSLKEWRNSSNLVFVQTNTGADVKLLDKNINEAIKQHNPSDKFSTYFTFPMNRWRLYSDFKDGNNTGGMIEYVRLFSIIALIILLIACINFMNLSTARSEKRAKEVGVRKTLGSGKKQLLLQFFFESLLLSFIAFLLSIIASFLLLPSFNSMVNKQLALHLDQPLFCGGALVLILFTAIVAGSYPALYLSSFNPVKVLKGTFLSGKRTAMPRQVLVVMQFAISILLISATIVVYQQIQYVKNRDMGYDPNNLVMIPASPALNTNYKVIREDLLKTGMINAVTRSYSPITDIWSRSLAPAWEGKPANTEIIMSVMSCDLDFIKTMGIQLLEGKDFSGMPSDSSSIILNKAAVEAMGLKRPLGAQLSYGPLKFTVTGITSNVVMTSPYTPVDPMMILYRPAASNFVSIRLNPGVQPQKALQSIGTICKKYNPAFPFEYKFIDHEFEKKFVTEELISKITNIFAGLAIFICCLGLAGLATFTIEKRVREIGIRKVLGASAYQVLMLISKEFLRLVAIAVIVAVPLTWWLMNNWLEKYAYRINISLWLFALVGSIMLLLTMAVVWMNTIRAALSKPVNSLRTE